jgi:hypothetical protein
MSGIVRAARTSSVQTAVSGRILLRQERCSFTANVVPGCGLKESDDLSCRSNMQAAAWCGGSRLARVQAMPDSLEDEIRQLAERVAASPDDVADLGAEIAAVYRRERQEAFDRAGISAFLHGIEEIDEQHPALVAVRERLRDRLKSLLEWAKETGRA